MDSNLTQSVISVCTVLNKHSVEYLIVGGTAVAIYGFYRKSIGFDGVEARKHDLDFWYNPSYKNYYNLLNALEDLGQDVTQFKEEQAPDPKKSFFKFESENFTIDFLPEVIGLSKFNASYQQRGTSNIDGIEIPIIAYDDLIINKQTTARQKDIDDIEQLKSKRDHLK